jgi:hypothetical protein
VTWWRRQRRALIALAVAAIAVVGTYVWLDVVPSIRPADRVVEAEDAADVSGQTLTVGPAEWGEFESPDGTRTLSIRLRASGGPDAGACGTATLTEAATSRTWVSSRSGVDVPSGQGETSCIAEPSSYRILLVFLLPEDADGPFVLDIEGRDSDVARFVVEP